MVEYITHNRNVITEPIYPEVVHMVSDHPAPAAARPRRPWSRRGRPSLTRHFAREKFPFRSWCLRLKACNSYGSLCHVSWVVVTTGRKIVAFEGPAEVLTPLILTTTPWGRNVTTFICAYYLILFKFVFSFGTYSSIIMPVRNVEMHTLSMHVEGNASYRVEWK